jgi:L-cysteine desulfidase
MEDGSYEAIAHTLINAIAIDSGLICDGAKASCAAKIASSVDSGLLGYEMYKQGNNFRGGDGILQDDVEHTIRNVGSLARNGMVGTDQEIIRIMVEGK